MCEVVANCTGARTPVPGAGGAKYLKRNKKRGPAPRRRLAPMRRQTFRRSASAKTARQMSALERPIAKGPLFSGWTL